MTVVYHLQKDSGKCGWKVNETWLFSSFQRKISKSNGTSEKIVLIFRIEYPLQKFVFHFFKAMFDTSFRPSRPFSGKWNWFVQMVNTIPEWHSRESVTLEITLSFRACEAHTYLATFCVLSPCFILINLHLMSVSGLVVRISRLILLPQG